VQGLRVFKGSLGQRGGGGSHGEESRREVCPGGDAEGLQRVSEQGRVGKALRGFKRVSG
jgi:hypothetical protein